MATPLYFIAHGGVVSDPGWLYSQGFRGLGVVVDGSAYGLNSPIPSTSGYYSVGFKDLHLNPYNDQGNPGGLSGCCQNGAQWTSWFTRAKQAGWTKIAGEGVVASVANECIKQFGYLNYAGDIGGYQWDVYGSNPRGTYSNSAGFYHSVETYVFGNQLSLASTKSVMLSAKAHGAGGVGILLGSWPMNPGQSGATWVNFINDVRGSGGTCDSVCFWCGLGYDITQMIKSGIFTEMFNTLKGTFGISDTWGGGPAPPGPGPGPAPAPVVITPGRVNLKATVRIQEYQPGIR